TSLALVAQPFLAVLLGFPRTATQKKCLRVPHPSRFLRRVGSYDLTPRLSASSLPLLRVLSELSVLCVRFLFPNPLPHSPPNPEQYHTATLTPKFPPSPKILSNSPFLGY